MTDLSSKPQCVWRTGCSATEQCRLEGRCTRSNPEDRERDMERLSSKEKLPITLRFWVAHLATMSEAALISEYSKLWAKLAEVCTSSADEIERLQRELASFQKANAELALRDTAEPPAVQIGTHPMIDVMLICDAYESGMGQGLKSRPMGEYRNPYDPVHDKHTYRAYSIGYDEGTKRGTAQPPAVTRPKLCIKCKQPVEAGWPFAHCGRRECEAVQDTEKLAWCLKVHEDLTELLKDGGGNMLHVRANRALGIMFEELEKVEKVAYPMDDVIRSRAFWSDDRRDLITAYVHRDSIALLNDNGHVYEPAGEEQLHGPSETKEGCRACKGTGVIPTGTPGERVACDCPAGETSAGDSK